MVTRRRFLQQAGVACAVGGLVQAQESESPAEDWPIVLFEKPVQGLSYEEIADEVARMGLRGLEATIRPTGHILPENAAKELPGMMKTLEAAGLDTVIAATRVIEPNEKTSDFLKILRDNGITKYRTEYFYYSKDGDPLTEMKSFQEKAKKLADLNEELGMEAIYQLHSGWKTAGSLLWDAAMIFKDLDPKRFGLGYDLRHTKTDGGLSWSITERLARKHITAIYVKDAKWGGERSDKLVNAALGTGFVTKEMFDQVRKNQSPMPISLHMEWGKHQLYPAETAREAWPLIRQDAEVLKKWRG
ncbi:sugar phosphate isomerase/epimerase family protein [Roseibacillus persicicus]|uniref:sugar phosphate isomerase/epimerase family protein n=1 Tax=Roseibacillus persicicus TaxID=454148 RepID=UPI00167A698A|nr:TIM barrel protein [Roseibacillus persicicus]